VLVTAIWNDPRAGQTCIDGIAVPPVSVFCRGCAPAHGTAFLKSAHVRSPADIPSAAPYNSIDYLSRSAAAAQHRQPLPLVLFDYSQRLLVTLLVCLAEGMQNGLLPERHSGAVLREVQRTARRCGFGACKVALVQLIWCGHSFAWCPACRDCVLPQIPACRGIHSLLMLLPTSHALLWQPGESAARGHGRAAPHCLSHAWCEQPAGLLHRGKCDPAAIAI